MSDGTSTTTSPGAAQRRHQDRREVLARLAGVERGGAAAQAAALDAQRDVPLARQVLDARPQPPQGVDQRPHRPLAQARHAVEPPAAGDHGEGRHQEAEHGAGVAAEDLDLAGRPLRPGVRRTSSSPSSTAKPQRPQGGEEQARCPRRRADARPPPARPRAAPGSGSGGSGSSTAAPAARPRRLPAGRHREGSSAAQSTSKTSPS